MLYPGAERIPAPPAPEGFPSRIMAYGYFKSRENWHPRQVDELYLDELEWIPVYNEAIDAATEYIRKQEEFYNR